MENLWLQGKGVGQFTKGWMNRVGLYSFINVSLKGAKLQIISGRWVNYAPTFQLVLIQ